jgi:hypothetical protein
MSTEGKKKKIATDPLPEKHFEQQFQGIHEPDNHTETH